MKRKTVYLLSKNILKLREYQAFFSNYHITVKQINDFGRYKNATTLLGRYSHLLKEEGVFSILADETQVFIEKTNQRIPSIKEQHDGELVLARTILYYLDGTEVKTITSTAHKGVIDYSSKSKKEDVFGWDDIFILRPLGISYQELKKRQMKNHSRQEVLSVFVKQNLYYDENISLNFHAVTQEEVISFTDEIFNFVDQNKLLNNTFSKKYGLNNLFQHALNNGGFFRSSKNRRHKNYWTPGLNAGIPLVPKKDEIHELTFFVHDLCHFILPDLIYNGENSRDYDRVYIMHRMLSEAISLVLADMVFIETLELEGIQYDFDKRKIYPLYKAIKRKNKDVSLKEIIEANAEYCILGIDDKYRELILEEDEKYLINFQNKYETFFKEDYKWTRRNLSNMQRNAKYFRQWYKENQLIFEDQNLATIEGFAKQVITSEEKLSNSQLMSRLLEKILGRYFEFMTIENTDSIDKRLSNSFKKYMLGQSLILHKMDFVNYSQFMKRKIRKCIEEKVVTKKRIEQIRNLYKDYLLILESDYHLIHKDDVATYQEVYPIFDSFYVFYDKEETSMLSLQQVSNKILGT